MDALLLDLNLDEAAMSASSQSTDDDMAMLLDGDEMLLLEQSLSCIVEDNDEVNDEQLNMTIADDDMEPLPLGSGCEVAASWLHHSPAPCHDDFVRAPPTDKIVTSAADVNAAASWDDLLAAAAQRQWVPRKIHKHGKHRYAAARPRLSPRSGAPIIDPEPRRHWSASRPEIPSTSVVAASAPSIIAPPSQITTQTETTTRRAASTTRQQQTQRCAPPQTASSCCGEEERLLMIRRLTASMRRSTETRGHLFGGESEQQREQLSQQRQQQRQRKLSDPPALPSSWPQQIMSDPAVAVTPSPAAHDFAATSPVPATSSTATAGAAQPSQSFVRLSGFLAGDLTTLTAGLQQSRELVRRHGSLVLQRGGHDAIL